MKRTWWFTPILVVIIALVLGTSAAVAASVLFSDEFTVTVVEGPPVEVSRVVNPQTQLPPGGETLSVYAIMNPGEATTTVAYGITGIQPISLDVAEVRTYKGYSNPPTNPILNSGTLKISAGNTLYLGVYCKIYSDIPVGSTITVRTKMMDTE